MGAEGARMLGCRDPRCPPCGAVDLCLEILVQEVASTTGTQHFQLALLWLTERLSSALLEKHMRYPLAVADSRILEPVVQRGPKGGHAAPSPTSLLPDRPSKTSAFDLSPCL